MITTLCGLNDTLYIAEGCLCAKAYNHYKHQSGDHLLFYHNLIDASG